MNEFIDFQKSFSEKWNKYKELHAQLDAYRGKEIGDNYIAVNKILSEIQDIFYEMYPAMEFMIHNYTLCVSTVNQYKEFIEDLKKEGATAENLIVEA